MSVAENTVYIQTLFYLLGLSCKLIHCFCGIFRSGN